MKRIIALLLTIACFSIGASAQTRYDKVRQMLADKGYTIGKTESQYLSVGKNFTKTLNFEKNTEYIVVAFSDDDDVTDIDLYITKSDGEEYKRDNDRSSVSVVSFHAYEDRDLTLKITNYASNDHENRSKVWYVVGYKED